MPDLIENPLHGPDLDLLAKWALLQEPRELAADFARRANEGDKTAMRWISRIYKDGMTISWLGALDKLVRKVDLVHNYRLNKESGTFELELREWGRIYPIADEPLFPNLETIYAYIVMRLVNAGIDKKVKQCEAPDCNNYHFKRGKWCYKDCGSRVRVRNSRKRKKEAQML